MSCLQLYFVQLASFGHQGLVLSSLIFQLLHVGRIYVLHQVLVPVYSLLQKVRMHGLHFVA